MGKEWLSLLSLDILTVPQDILIHISNFNLRTFHSHINITIILYFSVSCEPNILYLLHHRQYYQATRLGARSLFKQLKIAAACYRQCRIANEIFRRDVSLTLNLTEANVRYKRRNRMAMHAGTR